MRKSSLFVLGLVLMVSGLVFGGGGQQGASQPKAVSTPGDPFGAYNTPVTIEIAGSVDPTQKFPAGDSLENNQYTRYVKEKLNIEVKYAWVTSPGNDSQRLNVAIASNNIPDGIRVGTAQFRQLVRAGMIEDLTAAIDGYASPAMKAMFATAEGKVEEAITFNGKKMGLPIMSVPENGFHFMWVRQDWLDQYGLAVPKTLDELKNVLRVFVKNGKMGISGQGQGGRLYANFLNSGSNFFGLDPVFTALDSYPGYWLKKDGKAVYGSILPETKAALAELRSMYAEGLIDKELGTRQNAQEPMTSGQAGLWFGPWWAGYTPLPDSIVNNPEANWQAYAGPFSKDGKWKPHLGTIMETFGVIKKGYAYPEVLVKLNNLMIRDESSMNVGALSIGFWPLRVNMAPADESPYTVNAIQEYLSGRKTINDFQKDFDMYKLLKGDLETIKTVKKEPYADLNMKTWDYNANPTAWQRAYCLLVGMRPIIETPYEPVYSLAYAQTKTMETRWVNLKTLEDEVFLKIILGLEPITAFDAFVTQWKQEGGDQITAEVQAEYVN